MFHTTTPGIAARRGTSCAVLVVLAMAAVFEYLPVGRASALVVLSSGRSIASVQRSQTLTVIDFPATPPTLRELLKAVDLVVLARVDATSRPEADRSMAVPRIRRIQDVTALEVLKGHASSPRIKVRQVGGTMIVDGKEHSVEYPVRLLEIGDVVVLFLKPVGKEGPVYDIAYGADGVVWAKDSDQRVELPAGLRRMPEFQERPPNRLADLLASIRSANELKAAPKAGRQ